MCAPPGFSEGGCNDSWVQAFLAAADPVRGCSVASAQDATIGAGKVEIGGFPGGGTFFVGGDDNKEVNFNVYTAGGGLTYYFIRCRGRRR